MPGYDMRAWRVSGRYVRVGGPYTRVNGPYNHG